jgi:hypothetical protein
MSIKRFIPNWALNFRRKYLVNHPLKRLRRENKLNRYRRQHKTIFLTFADGKNFTFTRIKQQAESSGFFDEIHTYCRSSLDEQFYQIFAEHIRSKRGFGYWCWKPYLLHKTLENMNENDMLVYADSGCTFSEYCKQALDEILLEHVTQKKNLFLAGDSNHSATIRQWTKADLLNEFKCILNPEVLNRRQWEANRIVLFNSPINRELCKMWVHYASKLHLIDDSPSKIEESKTFIEHRHDQSIFNLLTKDLPFSVGLENAIYATRLRE